ncbi:MAG: hypothetical protein A2Z83_06475 [Omnitrophica bacterium GWA2_52_8]|nr:MAG: hypothetical protein A2Z83_06475 [Omnitrophica bacterium GWA2_52_8]
MSEKSPAKAQWQDKREKVLGKHAAGKIPTTRILLIVAIMLLGSWFYFNLPESGNPIIKASPAVAAPAQYPQNGQQMTLIQPKVGNEKVIIPLDVLKEKKFVKFNYGDPQYGIPMLAYISTEGKIVTAVSVCEPCNSTAFHINGDKIVCNACGSTWELNTLESVSGSCGRYPPDALPNTVVGNEIQIEERLVARWQRRG